MPRRSIRETIDTAANVLTVVTSLALLVFALKVFVLNRPSVHEGWSNGEPAPKLLNVDYSASEQTLVLALRSSCQFFNRMNLPLYQAAVGTFSLLTGFRFQKPLEDLIGKQASSLGEAKPSLRNLQ